MDYVYKMLKKALKNKDFATIVKKEFSLFGMCPILNLDMDWDWNYEMAKVDWLKKMVDARNNYTHRSVLKNYKNNKPIWYDEHQRKAKYLLGRKF